MKGDAPILPKTQKNPTKCAVVSSDGALDLTTEKKKKQVQRRPPSFTSPHLSLRSLKHSAAEALPPLAPSLNAVVLLVLRLSATSTAVRPALSPIVQSAPASSSSRTAVGDCANAAQWRAVCPWRLRAERRGSSAPRTRAEGLPEPEDERPPPPLPPAALSEEGGGSRGVVASLGGWRGFGWSRAARVAALAGVSTADKQATMSAVFDRSCGFGGS